MTLSITTPHTLAPAFRLRDILSGAEISLEDLAGQIVVLTFWSCDCPWSRQYDSYFARQAPLWQADSTRLLYINSNANETIDEMQQLAAEQGITVPILHDPDQTVADTYGATTTPQVFVIAPDGRLVYQGAVDNRTFHQREATINYLEAALEAIRQGRLPEPSATPAYGCTIVRRFDAH